MLTGDEIRQARLRAQWSQEELAAIVGVSMRSIGNYERGSTVPRNKMPVIEEALSAYTGGDGPSLHAASDAQLLAEVANRMERGRKAVVHDEQEASQAPIGDEITTGRDDDPAD